MIANQAIETAGYEIMKKAAIDIPEDYLAGIKVAKDRDQYPVRLCNQNHDRKLRGRHRRQAADVCRHRVAALLR